MSELQQVEKWLDVLEERSEQLSDWETTFVDSCQHQLCDNRHLSMKQCEKLREIHERVGE